MNEQDTPLLVEVFLNGARIKGLCDEVQRGTRLAEVLNMPSEVLRLDSAVVMLPAGAPIQTPTLAIEKKSIIAAIPWETKEQDRQRALLTSFSGRSHTVTTDAVAFVPPIVVAGQTHTSGAGVGVRELRADPSMFARFFSMTNVRMTLPDGSTLDAPVALVNRDLVSAMGRSAPVATQMAV